MNFLKMNLYHLFKNAINFNFKKFNPHIMVLFLTFYADYALTAASVIKSFVDTFDYKPSNILSDDYSKYPLVKQQFELEENKFFNLIQVMGLTNDYPVSEEHRQPK